MTQKINDRAKTKPYQDIPRLRLPPRFFLIFFLSPHIGNIVKGSSSKQDKNLIDAQIKTPFGLGFLCPKIAGGGRPVCHGFMRSAWASFVCGNDVGISVRRTFINMSARKSAVDAVSAAD